MKLTHHQKGAIWNAAGSIMFAANSVIMLIAVSQTSDVQTVGNYSIALTVAQLLYTVGTFGATNLQMTDYQKTFPFAAYARLKLMSSLGMMVLCVLVILLSFSSWQKALFTLLLTLLYLLNSAGDLYQSQFFQKDRLDLSGQSLFFRTFLSCLAFIIVIAITRDLATALVVMLMVNLAATYVLGVRRVRGYVEKNGPSGPLNSPNSPNSPASSSPPNSPDPPNSPGPPQSPPPTLRRLAAQAVLLFLSDFLAGFLLGAPRFSIDWLLDDAAQGYFALIFMPVFVINLLSMLLFKPALNKCAQLLEKRELAAFWSFVARQALLIIALTVLAILVIPLIGIPVLSWLYGIDLSVVKLEFIVITMGGGVMALCNIGYYLLVIRRRQRGILVAYSLALVAAIALCVPLIKLMGLMGACVGFALSHLLLFILFLMFTLRSVRSLPPETATQTPHNKEYDLQALEQSIPEDIRARQRRQLVILKEFARLCDAHKIPYSISGGTALGAARHQGFIPWDDDVDVYLFRDDYLRLRDALHEKLQGKRYRLLDPELDKDYIKPTPHFVDTKALCIGMDYRKSKAYEYLKMGIDILIQENVPDDDKLFKTYVRRMWILGKLFYITATPCPNIPFKNKAAHALCAGLIWCAHVILRLPPFKRAIINAWNRNSMKYYGQTNGYAWLLDTWVRVYRVQREEFYPAVKVRFEDAEFSVARDYKRLLTDYYGDYLQIPPPEERKVIPYYRVELPDEES